ncbi:MAG: vitamin K epoxide reductase family protein [Ardenticatenaceae bacterium]|nr:vitamin K epoxide reductase family protein [Anaerolineales bacterium]MCB8923411.1 vitamin K epoxide reductase family protein [Ardenticatenaceae bacterium]MCB9003864.1 vitamin K epoxide reductase family protein [Ardenticatenaceae bacterium]
MRIEKWQIRFIQLLAVAGMLVAFFLYLFHEGSLVGVCSASGWDDCGQVSGPDAPYAAIGPIPVALIGLVGYVFIFLLTWLQDWLPIIEDYMPELMIGTTALAFLFTLGLTGLELFVIHAICRYCVISAVIVTIMFALSVSYLREVNQAVAGREQLAIGD